MKVTVHDIMVNCPKHGKVPYHASSDLGGEGVTMYCPRCEKKHASSTCTQHLHIQFRAHHHRLSRHVIAATEDSAHRQSVDRSTNFPVCAFL